MSVGEWNGMDLINGIYNFHGQRDIARDIAKVWTFVNDVSIIAKDQYKDVIYLILFSISSPHLCSLATDWQWVLCIAVLEFCYRQKWMWCVHGSTFWSIKARWAKSNKS